MEVAFIEDIAKEYSDRRKGVVTEDDVKDLIKIFFKYLSLKIKSDDYYAVHVKNLGMFHKEFEIEDIFKFKNARTKNEKLLEKQLVENLFRKQVRKEYKHEELELLTQNTNHRPIEKK